MSAGQVIVHAEPRRIQDLVKSAPNTIFWSGYIHLAHPDQTTRFEYRNMGLCDQTLVAAPLGIEGTWVRSLSSREYVLKPGDFLRIDAGQWVRDAGETTFTGHMVLLINDPQDPGPNKIPPAVTSYWTSPMSYCEIAAQGFAEINTPQRIGKTTFCMFCPAVHVDARRTTLSVLINTSSNPGYADRVELHPILSNLKGECLMGRPVQVAPFGVMALDAAVHFGDEGQKLLAATGGRGSLSITHLGHIFPSYFFHMDRQTRNIVAGQHTQPPSSMIKSSGVWWGRIRQLVV